MKGVGMNNAATIFRDLLNTWQHDASSEHIESLAAELSSCVASTDTSLCVALMNTQSIPSLFGLIYFLDGYGLLLRQRYRQKRDGVFIYVDRKVEVAHEFTGSYVQERALEPVYLQAA
jgi:predicted metal-binding protein